MAEETNISWADATLNFWISCTKVSVGDRGACSNCYAETWAKRFGIAWGPHAERIKTKGWTAKIRKIIRVAKEKGIERPFVFSNSLSDIFDNQVPLEWLREALDLMRAYPEVTFLLLTKRPQNILKRFTEIAQAELGPYADEQGIRSMWPRNAAIGCTVVTQEEADRDIQHLLWAKAALNPAFIFLSMEPLLGPVNLTWVEFKIRDAVLHVDVLSNRAIDGGKGAGSIDWVITGGESGAKARPSNPAWFKDLRDQCAAAGTAFQHKQNGEWTGLAELQPSNSPADVIIRETNFDWPAAPMVRIGKKAAGRLLDGVAHDARPAL